MDLWLEVMADAFYPLILSAAGFLLGKKTRSWSMCLFALCMLIVSIDHAFAFYQFCTPPKPIPPIDYGEGVPYCASCVTRDYMPNGISVVASFFAFSSLLFFACSKKALLLRKKP
ncbi:MAG: hypothetical protein FWC38_05050 [Proteobacteria bacterium]|nr:hypothetical protein [Pseudomonadota bacterium]MCL2307586.1 hypothetical protein [Pseudomonadota bacterium]